MLTGARAELATRRRRRTRTRPACGNGRAGRCACGNASACETVTLAPCMACHAARVTLYMGRYRLPLAMLALSPMAVAAHAAGVAHADVVPFAWVSDVVRDETRYRASLESAERAGNVSHADAPRRLAESIGRVCDAVCDAAEGWDAEPVVAIESGNACDAATLQQSGVSYVRRLATVTGGFVASHNGRATAAFDSIADAVAHAAGPVLPVILPGEDRDAVAAALATLRRGPGPALAELARAQSAAIRADGDAAHARGIARAAGMQAAINAELARY